MNPQCLPLPAPLRLHLYLILFLLLLVSGSIQAQRAQLVQRAQRSEISVRAFPSSWYNSYFEPGLDGMGLSVAFHPVLKKSWWLNVIAEFSVLRSRNEFLLGAGINKSLWQTKGLRIGLETNLLNGVDLYRPLPLYVGGVEGAARFDYTVKNKLTLFFGIGARYTICPGYRDYGVWKHNSWPLAIGVRF